MGPGAVVAAPTGPPLDPIGVEVSGRGALPCSRLLNGG